MNPSVAPADLLMRELFRTRRGTTAAERAQIVAHIAAAPFDPRRVRVRPDERGTRYGTIVLGESEDSLTYHLVKRVVIERQWGSDTTSAAHTSMQFRARFSTQMPVFASTSGGVVSSLPQLPLPRTY